MAGDDDKSQKLYRALWHRHVVISRLTSNLQILTAPFDFLNEFEMNATCYQVSDGKV